MIIFIIFFTNTLASNMRKFLTCLFYRNRALSVEVSSIDVRWQWEWRINPALSINRSCRYLVIWQNKRTLTSARCTLPPLRVMSSTPLSVYRWYRCCHRIRRIERVAAVAVSANDDDARCWCRTVVDFVAAAATTTLNVNVTCSKSQPANRLRIPRSTEASDENQRRWWTSADSD